MVDETRLRRRSGSAYKAICEAFYDCAQTRPALDHLYTRSRPARDTEILHLAQTLQGTYGADWLQACASLFGMLMHFSLSKGASQRLVNCRRPKQPNSSYPNSPALARLLASRILNQLFTRPIPRNKVSIQAAYRYAERALTFRIIDPSMESGQLLLEVAREVVDRVNRVHASSTKSAAYLTRALLERLYSHCLWGIDRNPEAIEAVQLVFVLFSRSCAIGEMWPSNLLTADALTVSQERIGGSFDGVINNPPWGDPLRVSERRILRDRFQTLERQTDTYIAFAELALRWLRPGGVFALVLPSQMLATQSTSKLRDLFSRAAVVEEIIVLPRSAFAQATVRGVVIAGRHLPTRASRKCKITIYPIVKDLGTVGPVRTCNVAAKHIRSAGGKAWWPLVAGAQSFPAAGSCLSLSRLSRVLSGIKVYARGEGHPRQTAVIVRERRFDLRAGDPKAQAAISGRDIQDFRLGRPGRHIKLGKWLAHQGEHALLRGSTRIFVRELCRRDGKLTAAVAQNGIVPLHGVLTLVPERIDPHILTAILNSSSAADYVRHATASFSKVDFQKITVVELQQMPIPLAGIDPEHRYALGLPPATATEILFQQRLIEIVKALSRERTTGNPEAVAEFEAIVQEMYTRTP
ncbi:MAG: hypothetical protein V7609_253 [Verrucomicrobiota bacterium]